MGLLLTTRYVTATLTVLLNSLPTLDKWLSLHVIPLMEAVLWKQRRFGWKRQVFIFNGVTLYQVKSLLMGQMQASHQVDVPVRWAEAELAHTAIS